MFKWIMSTISESVLMDEFGTKKQYIDNRHRFLTLVLSGLCLLELKSCVTVKLLKS